MTEWKQTRFWKTAAARETDGGFAVFLDERALRTPAKKPLVVPSRALADAIAREWDAQPGDAPIAPSRMPLTRTANSALDKVALQKAEVADLLAEYGAADLLCYRAEGPDRLRARQNAAWDPLLDWIAGALNAPLRVGEGIVYVDQPAPSIAILRRRVHALDHFQLAAFHDLVALSGSLVIALAAAEEIAPPEALWALSRIDETWQAEQWGADDEATEMAALKAAAFFDAHRFYMLHGEN